MNILPGAGRKWKRSKPREPEYSCVMADPPAPETMKTLVWFQKLHLEAPKGLMGVEWFSKDKAGKETSNGIIGTFWSKRGGTELRAIVRDPVQRKFIERYYGTIWLNKLFFTAAETPR